ncbi:MAG: AAA domain-containing protein [Nitrosopumilaceae archaeon]|nr:AAA domain-containing protein [Nitrosopumilaceae archaeon]NIU00510.1 AAA domain-containing protein [Nitrosopumilaceae archaeon]NIU86893.1 AAA domain-containing protein [Nitrosopumilaceae archaeon]NIV65573.1 AAA domain-containing protein [Nitrosopumilaceae archaeon]NIX61112.1 AAA domain-containing protein [Nitrosopumilaceae archaeon]
MSESFSDILENSFQNPPKYTEIQAGVPEDYKDIKTLRDLLSINYKLLRSKDQLRKNLINLIKNGESKYPGIIGFEEDVIPSLDRAILSGHDIFLVGQIGQAKTKLVETIAKTLLSPIPVIKDSLTNDCPFDLPQSYLLSLLDDNEPDLEQPVFYISPESEKKIRDYKLDTPIQWKEGTSRYRYILATPDISVKDLVGYIDAIKVAKKGVEMYKIESYSPGQLMQAKHGILCIDELPVLDPRKQVALLSVLQEGRFTTGSYPIIFKPQTSFFATANPIDYTHSGKIIEPLYDRLKSHIHTHYPASIEDEMAIILQEIQIPQSAFIPLPILKLLTQIVRATRNDPQINQEKGVSVRLGIHGLELLIAEAERCRSIPKNLKPVPRLSDLHCLDQVAKFELMELDDTIENRKKVFGDIVQSCVKENGLKYLEGMDESVLNSIKEEFKEKSFSISQVNLWSNGEYSYQKQLESFPNLKKLIDSKYETIKSEQEEAQPLFESRNISTYNISIDEVDTELRSVITEIILESLCWTQPKILDKREYKYVAA